MVNSQYYIPQCGDAVWITLNPQAGHERAGRRPAVVISPQDYNSKVGLAILCPITNQIKGYPFEVRIPTRLLIAGAILSDRVKSLDWRARNATLICVLPRETISQLFQKMIMLLNPEI